MKIEVGESLVSSYLNHVEGCRIIQTNWKTSSNWKVDEKINKEAEELYNKINSNNDFSNVLKTDGKKNSFSQFIKQAEIDVLGIDTSELRVFGIDIAFHSSGLNYSSSSQTSEEIVLKKIFRTALIMKIYFEQYDKFESIFVSPKINPSLQKKIDILLDKAKDLLSSHNIDIKVISNTTFYNEMLDPLLKKGSKENDTSELFLRSYKLLEMASKSNSTISKIKPVTKSKNIHMKKEIKGMKIGQFVQHCFRDAFDQNLIKDDEIKRLQDTAYSKNIFNANFEVLRFKNVSINDKNGRARYYKKELFCRDYRLSSQWYEEQWDYLLKWLREIGYKYNQN